MKLLNILLIFIATALNASDAEDAQLIAAPQTSRRCTSVGSKIAQQVAQLENEEVGCCNVWRFMNPDEFYGRYGKVSAEVSTYSSEGRRLCLAKYCGGAAMFAAGAGTSYGCTAALTMLNTPPLVSCACIFATSLCFACHAPAPMEYTLKKIARENLSSVPVLSMEESPATHYIREQVQKNELNLAIAHHVIHQYPKSHEAAHFREAFRRQRLSKYCVQPIALTSTLAADAYLPGMPSMILTLAVCAGAVGIGTHDQYPIQRVVSKFAAPSPAPAVQTMHDHPGQEE